MSNRIHPTKDMLETPPELLAQMMATDPNGELEERQKIAKFSWDLAIKMFDAKMMTLPDKCEMYHMDGRLIKEESYMKSVTLEICREYGLELLDVVTDLILPVGFAYPSLISSLPQVVEDAFKPISRTSPNKVVLWVEDIHWKSNAHSITELLMRHLLLSDIKPYLISPMKHFDQEVISSILMKFAPSQSRGSSNTETDEEKELATSWKSFSILIKFAFLVVLRSAMKSSSVIVLQIPEKVAEEINAYELLDFAEAEGHLVKYVKNTASCFEERLHIVDDMVDSLLKLPQVEQQQAVKKLCLEPGLLDTTEEPEVDEELYSEIDFAEYQTGGMTIDDDDYALPVDT